MSDESDKKTENFEQNAVNLAVDPTTGKPVVEILTEEGAVLAPAEPIEPPDANTRPEDIEARLAAIGGKEDELDRVARLEEEKLAARRQATRKSSSKKGGLETAASKKLAKIGTRAEPRRVVAYAADADPLLQKTEKLSEWAKKNQTVVQIVGGLLAVSLLGLAGYLYIDHKHELEASGLLAKAVADERARIGEPLKEEEESDGQPVFKTYDDRRDAALKKYREVEARFPKSGAAILARLSEGSLLLDKRDSDGAAAAYTDVKGSALAAADQEVKGRAIEGLGFALELKGEKEPSQAAKYREDALKTYKELENTVEVRGFKELAMYHQARVLMAQGEKDKAKELLKSLRERLEKPAEGGAIKGMNIPMGPPYPYLNEVVQDRLHQLDPNEAPRGGGAARQGGGGAPKGITPAQMKQFEEMLKKQGAGGGPGKK